MRIKKKGKKKESDAVREREVVRREMVRQRGRGERERERENKTDDQPSLVYFLQRTTVTNAFGTAPNMK